MKRTIFILSLSLLLTGAGSCIKETGCQDKTVQSEDASMQAFATANGMIVTKHSSGMYYQIINAGSGTTPTSSSTVSVKYIGKRLDGTIFDQAATATSLYPLTGFITGWQLGIPLIKKGGMIKLIIPSSLAYGCNGAGTIAGNAILYFEIELVDVQ